MTGLLEQPTLQSQPPGANIGPQAAAPPASPPPGTAEAPPAVPEPAAPATGLDQQQVDAFIANGLKIVHDPKISDMLIARVVNAKNPIPAIADATISIVVRLEHSAKSAGKVLSLTTIAYGGNYIMGEIIASAEAAGMKKMTDEAKYQAYSLAVGKYLDDALKTGKMTKEQLTQLGKDAEGTPLGQKIIAAAGGPGTAPNAQEPAQKPGVMQQPGMTGGNNGGIA